MLRVEYILCQWTSRTNPSFVFSVTYDSLSVIMKE